MVRPVRNKKPVNYSQFEDSDSDDDFVSAPVPLNKKSRTISKELKQTNPKASLKNLQKEDIVLPEKTPKKRVALDDKLFQRGLEVALALSVKEVPTVTNDVQKSQDKSLDKIMEEDDVRCVQGRRKAASKAVAQQRKMLSEGSGGDSADDSEPGSSTSEDSEENSDFGENEDNDINFTVRKSKVTETNKKAVKVKFSTERKEKKSKPKCDAVVTSVDSAPTAIKSESQSSPKKISVSSEATKKPVQMCSPSAEVRRPKWVPPAASGSSSYSSSPLARVSTKSPSQSLRLGLSRLARVKPLHPNLTSSQMW
ncbi:RAD51-associated protein 1 isoform X2 [Castor canadensis]|uniref:RAD51-associated protein 1 isoform X2 n=1 Tax=Castor canadensis TaxID=51338 RepID=A0AC58MSF4_CASCN